MKYNIDPELHLIAKLKMPRNPKLLPLMNHLIRSFRCKSDEKVTVKKARICGYQGGKLRAYVIEPGQAENERKPLPSLVFFHGGGFMLKASNVHYKIAKEYAAKLPCKVVYVDYRLAPEFPFPTPVEDCFATYQWVLKHADKLGIDKNNIFLGGDSAGGNLAAAVTLMARDRKLPLPKGVLLIYPVTDRRMITASMQNFTDTPVWDAKLNRMMWQCYLGDQMPEHVEYASLMEAESLDGFPPTYMEVAEFDCLHDEGVNLYEKIKATGVATELHEVKGGCHGYETASNSLIVRACMDCRIAWMKKLLEDKSSAHSRATSAVAADGIFLRKTKEDCHGLYHGFKKTHRASANSNAGRVRHGFKRKEAVAFTKAGRQRVLGVSRWGSGTGRKL